MREPLLGAPQPAQLPLRDEPARVHPLQLELRGQPLGARGHDHHVLGRLHHRPRKRHRVPHGRDGGDRACSAGPPTHHGRVHLHGPVGGEHRAAARVEHRVVLEPRHRSLGGAHRVRAGGQRRAGG